MVFFIKKILCSLLLPPTVLLVISAIGIFLTRGAFSEWGYFIAYGALMIIFTLSIPAVANRLLHLLEVPPFSFQDSVCDFGAIVVLGAGKINYAPEYMGCTVNRTTLQRLRYAAHLQRIVCVPILVSGGAPFGGDAEANLMARVLVDDFNVSDFWIEAFSRDSSENAKYSAVILREKCINKVALVSEPWHLKRSIKFFEKEGICIIPAPTGFVDRDHSALGELLPKSSALDKSVCAIKEYVAAIF